MTGVGKSAPRAEGVMASRKAKRVTLGAEKSP